MNQEEPAPDYRSSKCPDTDPPNREDGRARSRAQPSRERSMTHGSTCTARRRIDQAGLWQVEQVSTQLPTVVIATRDRRERLLATLAHLDSLVERPAVVVVDNASSDGSAAAASRFPRVKVIEAQADLGSAARTLGVETADTPLVAFSDDDSWWAPGALRHAAELFQVHPRLGL